MVADFFRQAYLDIHDRLYEFKTVRLKPSEWTEKNIYLTSDISRYTGYYKYDVSPYTREVIDCLDPSSPVEMVAVMKCAQSGFTQGVIIPGICYIISETPSNTLFMAADKELVRNSIRTRLDPILQNSGLSDLIRANVVKKKNQRTGDTDFSKEFAGGSLTAEGTKNADKLRQISVKYIFADDWDAAPRDDKKEGSIRSLLEKRARSFGSTKKIFYISTPTVEQTSNILEVYDMGDQRKWHWCCPNCSEYIPMEWRVKLEDGSTAGITYELTKEGELIPESVHYKCQNCGGKIYESQKFELNLSGKWLPTATPKRPQYRSYQLNALVIPPGFDSWVDLVYQWLEAVPPNTNVVDEGKLKTFLNTSLGQTWEEKGKTPKVTDLMNNTRSYKLGLVPDTTAELDGNRKIVLLTLACDLGGIMNENIEDVRLDWELIAHTSTGVTYSVDHGSIGTFKRKRRKTKRESENDTERIKWTYNHGQEYSVWPELYTLMKTTYLGESGNGYDVDITVIDTGHFTRLAYQFINITDDAIVVGVKGAAEADFRKVQKDTPIIKRSREMVGKLYLLEVNQIKDILASNMRLKQGLDGYQPTGFMNFPQPERGKYTLRSYFKHFEGEHRVEQKKGDQVTGFAWKKKNSDVVNHFWDVYVYNLAAREIYIDIMRRSSPNFKNLDWESFVSYFEEN